MPQDCTRHSPRRLTTMQSPSQRALRRWRQVVSGVVGLLAAAVTHLAGATEAPGPLPALGLDSKSLTVSGLSSGGFMAAQFEVAFSRSVVGAGIVAGGPYGCSSGSVTLAMLDCSCPFNESDPSVKASRLFCNVPPPPLLAERARATAVANKGGIDSISNLKRHRVWLYSGDDDPVVNPKIVDGLEAFLALEHVPKKAVQRVRGPHAGHGMPIVTHGNCEVTRSPYINGCSIDGAGELLKWVYQQPTLQPGTAQAGALHRFDQRPYRKAGEFDSLDDSGWVYIPQACEKAGAHCKLHVAFHGCEQGQNFVVDGQPYGTIFVEQAGYNRWAESAGIVVLYPQVMPSAVINIDGSPYKTNPKGCWDFWGYTYAPGDASNVAAKPYARKDAPQLRAVKAMVDSLMKKP
jgi:poly(3-hydroxybutyrate) depolymerase